MVKDSNGSINPELSVLSDLGLGKINNNVSNEIEIMRSRTLVEKTVKKLNLNVALLIKGRILNTEIFQNPPIKVNFSNLKNSFYTANIELKYLEKSPDSFILESVSSKIILKNKKKFRFGEVIKTPYGDLIINKSTNRIGHYKRDNRQITIVVSSLDQIVSGFRNRLNITPSVNAPGFIVLSIVDPVIKKAEVFLNAFIDNYNQDAISDKNAIFEKTSNFISNRLKVVTQELDGVEQNVVSFKKSNDVLLDVESESSRLSQESIESSKKLEDIDIQLNLISSMSDLIKKSSYADLLPNNIFTGQSDINGLVNTFNQLVLDRSRILKSATTANPAIVRMEQQITSVKSNIVSGLNRFQTSLNKQKADLQGNETVLKSKIERIPVMERQFKAIARQQKVKEGLYLYLLQKREESAISLSASISNAKIIDAPKALLVPVLPNKGSIYLVTLFIGLFIPLSLFYLIELLNNKIKSRFDLQGKTTIPFLGDLPKSYTPNEVMKSESRSSSAEALRIISTNLQFMLAKVTDGQAKTIFLTSTFPKEGKTFVSVNLAATFALSGKKVLMMSMDIRNPKLEEYVSLPDSRGITNYLSSKDLKIEDLIIRQEGFKHFDLLPPGVIPPNPAELLMGEKVEELFKYLKSQYDYIIVDTPPVNLVTDTLLLAKYSDCFVYIVRANLLEKGMLHVPNTLYKEKKLSNMCILLNDTDPSRGSYGYYGYYGYGYGYGEKIEKKPWYKRVF
jgi:capsular exopolysaccharide synthesis family protein